MSPELMDRLVPVLASTAIAHLKRAVGATPIARLKLWYYDTSAPEYYLLADVLTSEKRDQFLNTKGNEALHYIWDETGGIDYEIDADGDPETEELLEAFYELVEEDEQRSAILAQRVARRLNDVDWQGVRVTDDFIVYAQNGTDYGCGCYEDMCASVPPEKLELLRSRKLMGTGLGYGYLKED